MALSVTSQLLVGTPLLLLIPIVPGRFGVNAAAIAGLTAVEVYPSLSFQNREGIVQGKLNNE
jgi:hypothetical protein